MLPATWEAMVEAFLGEQYRLEDGQKLMPRAETPRSAKWVASAKVVTPQILREGLGEKSSGIMPEER